MNVTLKLEEFAQFLIATILFYQFDAAWWVFPACLLLPDFSMIGYLVSSKVGAWTYNFVHHKLVGIVIGLIGFYLQDSVLQQIGLLLFAHAAMDRVFGYGLKFEDSFHHTHLGWIGKSK